MHGQKAHGQKTHGSVDFADIATAVLARIRERAPRVHCITNTVAQQYTANMLLAAGAVPSMTLSPQEIGAFVAGADALLVNLGTFDAERRSAVEAALSVAAANGKPWLLDPVFIERSPARAEFARGLLGRRPAVVRLNQAEFAALSINDQAGDAPARLAKSHGAIVALTGRVDIVADGARRVTIANGDPLMGLVTGHGLRRLGVGLRRARGRKRCVARDDRGAHCVRYRRRSRGTRRRWSRQLCRRHYRRAAQSRPRDFARARKGPQ